MNYFIRQYYFRQDSLINGVSCQRQEKALSFSSQTRGGMTLRENSRSEALEYLRRLEKEGVGLKKNLLRLNTQLKKKPLEELERAGEFLPFMILQMQDEDLKKLDGEYPRGKYAVLMAMLLFPKERWKELGIPDYLMKYEITEDEEDEEDL